MTAFCFQKRRPTDKEDAMPPLTTPATAVLFMIAFFVVMMGVPLLILRVESVLHSVGG